MTNDEYEALIDDIVRRATQTKPSHPRLKSDSRYLVVHNLGRGEVEYDHVGNKRSLRNILLEFVPKIIATAKVYSNPLGQIVVYLDSED